MVPSWADQLLLQLLMEQFDTLPIQCRHIEHMREGVWLEKIIFEIKALRVLVGTAALKRSNREVVS